MYSGRLVSVKRVLEKFYRDYKGLAENIDFHDVIEWIGEAMALIGSPIPYVDKVTDGNKELNHPEPIEIINYRGELPCDVYQIKQCYAKIGSSNNQIMMRRTTDTFYNAYLCPDSDTNKTATSKNAVAGDLTYKVNNNFIFTSFKDGKVIMAYRAYPTDSDCYPLVPDNERYLKALESYLAERVAFIKVLNGQLRPDIYQKIEQDWLWYVSSAETSMSTPSYSDATTWKNILIRLIPNINEDLTGFKNIGVQERRYNQSTERRREEYGYKR